MLTDRDLDPEVGYTDEEVRGLCFLLAAAVYGRTQAAPEVAARRLAESALRMAPIVGEAIRTGEVPDAE